MLSAFETCAVGQNLHLQLTQPDIPVNNPVAHEAVERALEAGGPILLKAKMPHPRKAITAEQSVQQVLWLATRYRHGKAHQRQA